MELSASFHAPHAMAFSFLAPTRIENCCREHGDGTRKQLATKACH